MSSDRVWLMEILPKIRGFLNGRLALELHPNKVSIATLVSGIDFLGWVHFPDHLVLRTSTKKRMFRGLKKASQKPEILQSYLGLLSHGNTKKIKVRLNDAHTASF